MEIRVHFRVYFFSEIHFRYLVSLYKNGLPEIHFYPKMTSTEIHFCLSFRTRKFISTRKWPLRKSIFTLFLCKIGFLRRKPKRQIFARKLISTLFLLRLIFCLEIHFDIFCFKIYLFSFYLLAHQTELCFTLMQRIHLTLVNGAMG